MVYLYAGLSGRLQKYPWFSLSRPVSHVSDRREPVRPLIQTKSRPTCSTQRAGDVYHTSNPFREHFPAPNKIIHLFNKWGFCSDGDGWSCAESCDGDRVNTRCRKRSCAMVEWFGHACRYEKEGENIHQLTNWLNKYSI